jgi:hypothetical protein
MLEKFNLNLCEFLQHHYVSLGQQVHRSVLAYFSKSQMCDGYIFQLDVEFASTLQ